jgi:predicted CXXCH cytochrome family protein
MKTNRSVLLAVSFLLVGLLAGLALLSTSGPVHAAPLAQDPTPTTPVTQEVTSTLTTSGAACRECHLDVADMWSHSPHAHAYDDPTFQEWWEGQGKPGDCLSCHTTGYQATSGTFTAEGVSCEGCHGEVQADHPPAVVTTKADTEYCGGCHTTTHSEWRLTGHAAADVGCMDCHDPHSQKALFEVADDMCLNCHEDDMGPYLEDTHIQQGIGCVDCHALVIPPEVPPDDGIVPTGHAFTISPATCVACHTDALHSGFALPGYENGAAMAASSEITPTATTKPIETAAPTAPALTPEQQIQTLEAALASQSMTLLFQGGVIGLVLGGTTAWFIAHNVRRRREPEEPEHETTEE